MKNLPKAMGNLSKALGGGGPLTDSIQNRYEGVRGDGYKRGR